MTEAIGWFIVILLAGFFATIAVIGVIILVVALFGAPLAALIRFIRG